MSSMEFIDGLRNDDLLLFFIKTINKLSALLDKENRYIQKNNVRAIWEFFEDKRTLVEIVRLIENRIILYPQIVENADPKLKSVTMDAHSNLLSKVMDTRIALEIKKRISGDILEYLHQNIVERRKQDIGYDDEGRLASKEKLSKNMPHMSLVDEV